MDDLIEQLQAKLKKASIADRMYERPMDWEQADYVLDHIAALKAENRDQHNDILNRIKRELDKDARIAALEAELERRKYDGEHTCHERCQRPTCALRREKAALEADNARLMELVGDAQEILSECKVLFGICACGEDMQTHGDSHTPTDQGHIAVSRWLQEAAKIKEATDG